VESTELALPELVDKIVERIRRFNFGPKEGVQKVTILYPIDFLPPERRMKVSGRASEDENPSHSHLSGALCSPHLRFAAGWDNTGSMTVGREGHTATLLSNGKVLVAGGWNNGGFQSSAELYDPATGTWSTTGSMEIERVYHTATLLQNVWF